MIDSAWFKQHIPGLAKQLGETLADEMAPQEILSLDEVDTSVSLTFTLGSQSVRLTLMITGKV
jgi:hypothetical protein